MKTIRRRRKESKTDYHSRFHMLKSGIPRLVVRKTNRYILAQIVESDIAQDKVVMKASSKELLEQGWPKDKAGSLKSLQACYLTGLLIAKKSKGIKEVILDLGLQREVAGSRIYAVLKGAVDGGLKIPHDSKVFPTDERMKTNEKLFKLVQNLKDKL